MTEREKERRRRKERKKEGRRNEEGGTEKGWNARSLIIGLLSLLSQLRTPIDYGIKIYVYGLEKDVIICRNRHNNDVKNEEKMCR